MAKEQLTPEQMDNAAAAAQEELMESYEHDPDFHLPELAAWWKKWYLLAGHKRLGRILMGVK